MYKIIFYTNKNNVSELQKYLQELADKRHNNKDCKIKFNKITAYLNLLSEKGLTLGEPYIKHLEGDIWELRPLRDRILFAYLYNNSFILLNCFTKKTQKTPLMEIEKAKRNLDNYFNRGD